MRRAGRHVGHIAGTEVVPQHRAVPEVYARRPVLLHEQRVALADKEKRLRPIVTAQIYLGVDAWREHRKLVVRTQLRRRFERIQHPPPIHSSATSHLAPRVLQRPPSSIHRACLANVFPPAPALARKRWIVVATFGAMAVVGVLVI